MHYQTLGPDAYVLGQPMLGFVESINFKNFEKVLKRHHLTQIQPDQWYPQQIWLDVFNDIAATSRGSASSDFVSIGMKLIEVMAIPPDFEAVPFLDKLRMFGQVYSQVNNRGHDIGYITTEVLHPTHVAMHDASPYPDDFVYGAYFSYARRFLPKGTDYSVYFDASTPRRDEGGSETIVHIEWR
jgi:hypothetical protein